MKFSEQWLREWVDCSFTRTELSEALSNIGLEVSAVESVAPSLDGVVIGKVVALKPHPDADRLRVCTVDVGQETPLTIVCGAPNVAENMCVPVAMVETVLPGDKHIIATTIRGVESFGMICSKDELGLSESKAKGIWPLPDDAPVGEALGAYLNLDDASFTVDLTPNRGDCTSVCGIARDVAALTGATFKEPAFSIKRPQSERQLTVHQTDELACPTYLGCVIEEIDATAQTPLWMQERLRRSGMRSLHPVVDVTNYVMLELGQPMHAFDLDTLKGDITVRPAHAEETLILLDGEARMLDETAWVIADSKKAIALAGVMGGAKTEVTEKTAHIFLEVAHFTPSMVRQTAKHCTANTDAAYRFERGVDPCLPEKAMARAQALLLEIVGGQLGPVSGTQAPFSEKTVTLQASTLASVLGVELPRTTVEGYLKGLGCVVKYKKEAWQVTLPSHRFDLELEVDLVEEVARLHGYAALPVAPLSAVLAPVPLKKQTVREEATNRMVALGFSEVVTYGFTSPARQALFSDRAGPKLKNPIALDKSVMRASVLTGLLDVLEHNVSRQQTDVRIFEWAVCFDDLGAQTPMLAGLWTGRRISEQWSESDALVDFYDMKGVVQALLPTATFQVPEKTPHGFHPGQSAEVCLAGQVVGVLGALHPNVTEGCLKTEKAFAFEIEECALSVQPISSYTPLSKFPATRRDLAFFVPDTIVFSTIEQIMTGFVGDLLKSFILFDVYSGKGVPEGQKSVSLGLFFQHESRTLVDSDVDAVLKAVVSEMTERLGAALRG